MTVRLRSFKGPFTFKTFLGLSYERSIMDDLGKVDGLSFHFDPQIFRGISEAK